MYNTLHILKEGFNLAPYAEHAATQLGGSL